MNILVSVFSIVVLGKKNRNLNLLIEIRTKLKSQKQIEVSKATGIIEPPYKRGALYK